MMGIPIISRHSALYVALGDDKPVTDGLELLSTVGGQCLALLSGEETSSTLTSTTR